MLMSTRLFPASASVLDKHIRNDRFSSSYEIYENLSKKNLFIRNIGGKLTCYLIKPNPIKKIDLDNTLEYESLSLNE